MQMKETNTRLKNKKIILDTKNFGVSKSNIWYIPKIYNSMVSFTASKGLDDYIDNLGGWLHLVKKIPSEHVNKLRIAFRR